MGFSVSGATAILFIAMFVSFGVLYSATYNGYERVSEAKTDHSDRALDQRNTALNITKANVTAGHLNLTVNNTGSTTLNVDDTDVLVDGKYETDFVARDVNGNVNTSLWLPGETYHVNVSVLSPGRVKIVTDSGVADTEVV